MARSPPCGASGEDRSDQRLRRAFSFPEKSMPPASAGCPIAWDCMGLHGLYGALGYLWPPPFCANQKIPRKGRHRHIRQSANLGTISWSSPAPRIEVTIMTWPWPVVLLDPRSENPPLAITHHQAHQARVRPSLAGPIYIWLLPRDAYAGLFGPMQTSTILNTRTCMCIALLYARIHSARNSKGGPAAASAHARAVARRGNQPGVRFRML